MAYRAAGAFTRRGFAQMAGVLAVAVALPGLAACDIIPGIGTSPSGTKEGTPPSSPQEYEEQNRTLFAFDTVVTLKAYCSVEAMDAVADRCRYFESIFSRTIEDSDIGRINAAGGKAVEVAPRRPTSSRRRLPIARSPMDASTSPSERRPPYGISRRAWCPARKP